MICFHSTCHFHPPQTTEHVLKVEFPGHTYKDFFTNYSISKIVGNHEKIVGCFRNFGKGRNIFTNYHVLRNSENVFKNSKIYESGENIFPNSKIYGKKYFHEFQNLAVKILKLFLQIPKFTKTVEIFGQIPKFMETVKIYSRIPIFMETEKFYTNSKIYGNCEIIFTNFTIYENGENIFMDFNGLNGLP